ncbi:hypothetical protein SAMN04488063_3497 [Halopelagius inordinatus]|uniref:DUF7344 domain-containing protein n=1 Tax=Halopelagius inordinatus TaxID=553467 RepID=A0A1I2WCK9_9EURY|nr:hypothetical protein [Halopelagius inordinatus]SFG99094.1 hypothetical protein SAMN04488063_3497 [Halopelagius inordinatus]
MAVTQNDSTPARSSDEHLAALGDEHRRAVVEVLAAEDRPVRLSRLAESVVAEMRDDSFGTPSHDDIDCAKLELHHHHLPKLDAAGVLDYDYEESRIVPTDDIHTVYDIVRSVTA